MRLIDLEAYSDEMLKNRQALQRYLFVATVENPEKTCHFTGLFPMSFLTLSEYFFVHSSIDYIIHFSLKGLSKECLEVLFQFLEKKAKRLRMWNGLSRVRKRNQPEGKMSKRCLKVQFQYFLLP